ncbi:MAG: hypothetical protein OIN86_13550 [Candidatus Methanoperedens sp.]|nr:hypothetical protein [Candidatus Methanoperedens sp.]CAG0950423.1 hypothetical protein METP1_00167 [Methanosarcinales archaeon]
MKEDWQPGYEECPDLSLRLILRICPMCGAGPGKIGIGCLECDCAIGNPEDVI